MSESITEMGVRDVVSTWAFLAGFPKKLKSYDIVDCPVQDVETLAEMCGVDFKFYIQDVIEDGFEIDETDLLFIDTLHTYEQLNKELGQHSKKVKKFIILHDTETFGYKDENETSFRKNPQGLIPAIDKFLEENPDWKIVEKIYFNNGLIVLENGRGKV
jgi:hypothetical protein